MTLDCNLSRLLVPIVMTIIGSYYIDRASAEATGIGDDAARVKLLWDDTAKAFLDGTWAASGDPQSPAPPEGAVLMAGDDVTVFAFVLGRTEAEAEQHLEDLAVNEEVEGCERGGVTCCDRETSTWMVDGESGNKRIWLRLNQRCKYSPVQEGWTGDPPSMNEPGMDFVEVRSDLWAALAQKGVTRPLMTLAGENRERRLLAKPSWRSGEILLPSPMIDRAGVKERWPIILANHIDPPQPFSTGCATTSYCKSDDDGRRCYADKHPTTQPHGNTKRHHWYSKDSTTGEWCEETEKCRCQ